MGREEAEALEVKAQRQFEKAQKFQMFGQAFWASVYFARAAKNYAAVAAARKEPF